MINLSVQFCDSLFTDNHPSCWKEEGLSLRSWLSGEVSFLLSFGWGRGRHDGCHLQSEYEWLFIPPASGTAFNFSTWMAVAWVTSPGLTTPSRICCHILWAVLSTQSSSVNWYWRFDNIPVGTTGTAYILCCHSYHSWCSKSA